MTVPPIPARDLRAIFGQPQPPEPESPPVSRSTAFALGFVTVALLHALVAATAVSIFVVGLVVAGVILAKTIADAAPRILSALKGEGGWL